jgi:hypothetical protein
VSSLEKRATREKENIEKSQVFTLEKGSQTNVSLVIVILTKTLPFLPDTSSSHKERPKVQPFRPVPPYNGMSHL